MRTRLSRIEITAAMPEWTGVKLRGPERSEGRRLGQTLPWFQDGGRCAGALAQVGLGDRGPGRRRVRCNEASAFLPGLTKEREMLERRICIILAALLTGCGAASPGAEVNGAEANERPGGLEERYLYDGEVAIEPVPLDVMLDRLLQIGCVRAPAANSWCTVIVDELPSQRRITIYPNGGACFGPCSFLVDGRKLHAAKDIPGERDDEKFKEKVRADVAKLGGVVKIVERTWKIKSRDARGIMY
ncbi:hypothetical protein WMF04_23190 [Sorangium sp. So ce260]|uniref:hypothetical protein n=1 Tax=Sorangium sp. So ce260 TaxID=3133291 RepID=UPI003F6406CD